MVACPALLNLTVARGAVRNYSNRRDKCDRLTVRGSAGALVLLRYHQRSTDKKNATEQTNLSEYIERKKFKFCISIIYTVARVLAL